MHVLDLEPGQLERWQRTPHAIPRADVVFRVEGPGAVSCLQGLFTNDLAKAGASSLLWGAVLTPKGMIITDCWMRRQGDVVLVIAPSEGADALSALFRRSLPPRLAKVSDLRDTTAVWWLIGGEPPALDGADVATPDGPAPFAAMAIGARDALAGQLDAAGWVGLDAAAGDALALSHGWPVLGREIDERTLIQEVRFDELAGVRYDKGCYVGQETVARLHFRGHPNRRLRAIVGRGDAPDTGIVTSAEGRELGTAATLARSGSQWIASVKLRREIESDAEVTIGGTSGIVTDFPISF